MEDIPMRQQDVVAMFSRCLSVRPIDVTGISQMKHLTQEDTTTTSHQYVFTTSQTNLK